jgi:hypothetical protein
MMRRHRQWVPVLLVTALAGCGPTPPQAPLEQAKKLDSATSGISTACGLSAQVTAFPPPDHAALVTLDVTASGDARKLASVFALDPDWIYQGETVRQIVRSSLVMLDACGLREAASTLRARTAAR